ncbi:MAG: hypothetical protein ACRBCL_12140 [Maritimibacter sp.]
MSEAVIGGDAAWLGSEALPLARGLTNLGSSSFVNEVLLAFTFISFILIIANGAQDPVA